MNIIKTHLLPCAAMNIPYIQMMSNCPIDQYQSKLTPSLRHTQPFRKGLGTRLAYTVLPSLPLSKSIKKVTKEAFEKVLNARTDLVSLGNGERKQTTIIII